MRLLWLTPAYPPFTGGGERYAGALATHLARAGTAVTILTSQAKCEQELWRGVSHSSAWEHDGQIAVLRLPIRPFPGGWRGLLAYRKLMVLLSALPGDHSHLLGRMAQRIPPIHGLEAALNNLSPEFDLVHGFNLSWEWPLWAGWQWARRHGLPFLTTPFMHFGTGQDRVARNTTMDHQRRLLLDSAQVLALTAVEQQGLHQMGVERVTVVGGGVEPPPSLGDTAVLRQQHQLSSPYFLFIGRASSEKGAIHAAQAVLALAQQGLSVTLGLIGQQLPEFVRFYSRLATTQQQWIRPLGLLSEVDKHTLLAGTVALLLPSRTDSFGIVLLEAWTHAIPVIGARAGGIPGVIDHEQNGLLVPFGNVLALAGAMRRLLQEPDLRQRLGAQGQQKIAQQYTWRQVAARTWTAYAQLLPPD